MSGSMTKAVLRTYLTAESVDEELLHYVCINDHTVLYIGLEQLCEDSGADEARIQAFLRAFGVDDFLAFKYILRKCLYHEATPQGVAKRSLNSLADETIRLEMQNLTAFASKLDTEKVEQLANDILAASQVTIFVRDAATPIASYMKRMLRLLRIAPTVYYEHSNYTQEDLDDLKPSGLVIIFARMRYSLKMLLDIKHLKQRGLRIVCFTDQDFSPFIPLADYHFVLPMSSYDFTDSMVSGTTFVHILALCLAMKREEDFYFRAQERDIKTQENGMFW